MKTIARISVALVAASLLLTGQSSLCAADAAKAVESKLPQKPAWLTELSVGVKESYDDNVFLAGCPSQYFPAYTLPAGSVAAVKNVRSFVTTISPKIGFDFVSLLGGPGALQTLTLSYAPDFAFYHEASSENYSNHRFGTAAKAKMGDFSFQLDNTFNYVNGNNLAPVYPGNFRSAYGYAPSRERRDQIQDRSTITFRYDQEKWFLRPTASLLYYELYTQRLAGYTGYQNYVDRYDVNGGGDLGYKLNKNLAVTVGYRYGAQYQQKLSAAIDPYNQSSSSIYQRTLLGLEGKLFDWLEFKIQAGPDFRRYGNTAPVRDQSPTTYYGDAGLTATFSKQDTVTFNYRQWRWVSGTGAVPTFEGNYDLIYRHKFNNKLSGNLGLRLQDADYVCGLSYIPATHTPTTAGTNLRHDMQYTVSAGVQYAFTANLSADLSYTYDIGANDMEGITNPNAREYKHQLISLGLQAKF